MKTGFVPALGTPFDENGKFLEDSYKKQIEDQINAGAVGILAMGSMGIQAFIPTAEYPKVAKAAVEAAAGRVPVYVGAMDCSIARVKDRIAAMEDLDIAGFVFTTPYYGGISAEKIMNYYRGIAAATRHKVLMYDLPGVTQCKITYEMVIQLLKEIPNLAGIKSADTQMFRRLMRNPEVPKDFIMVYSGLDTFDVVYPWGIRNQLDGMLSCTPKTTAKMYAAMAQGDFDTAGACLDDILSLRNLFIANDLWPSYSIAMNLLGYEGNYGPDYVNPAADGVYEKVKAEMQRIGEI